MAVQSFDSLLLRRICDVLGDTSKGLTNSEIDKLLKGLGIDDPGKITGENKRTRIYLALSERQNRDRCGNNVVAFIQAAMNPVSYTSDPTAFDERRSDLNEVLSFAGLTLGEDGKLSPARLAKTLSESEQRADRLRKELLRRNVHPDVLAFCKSELVQKNYFHAVFEATKSVAEKIRVRTGLTKDGAPLVDEAFSLGAAGMPFLAFNTLQTTTERSEQTGLMNLIKGMFGTFRNTTAHAPKVSWNVTEEDALDLLTLASMLHRRLDAAARTPRSS